jgi:hypothetical protein
MASCLSLFSAKKEDDPEAALKAFRSIVDQESSKGDWFDLSYS